VPFDPQGRLAPILKRRGKLGPSVFVFGSPEGEYQDSFRTAWESLVPRANGHDWTSADSEKGMLSFPSRKSGHGLLIATSNGQLDGYWTEGAEAIEAKDVDKWNQWHLSKRSAS